MARSLRQDLLALRKKKRETEDAGRKYRNLNAEFKTLQGRVLLRMEAEETDSMKTGGTLFSRVEKIKGQIEDRRVFVRWALENDYGVHDFIEKWMPYLTERCTSSEDVLAVRQEFEESIYDMMMGTELVKLKEDSDAINRLARTHLEDGQPLPPGLTFRPDNYISMRAD